MLAPILAAIIIILLIIYAAYPLLTSKNFQGWANIALTSLILFTVIVTLFVILGNRKGEKISFKAIPSIHQEGSLPANMQGQNPSQIEEEKDIAKQNTTNVEEISDEEALMEIAKEYLDAEEAFKAQGHSDYQQRAAQQIINRYDFTKEDWQTFLEDAAKYDLFSKAKEEMK